MKVIDLGSSPDDRVGAIEVLTDALATALIEDDGENYSLAEVVERMEDIIRGDGEPLATWKKAKVRIN